MTDEEALRKARSVLACGTFTEKAIFDAAELLREHQRRSWEYPPRGSITGSCGHVLHGDDTGECLSYWDWDEWGDLVEFCVSYCPWCALEVKVSGRLICDRDRDPEGAETVQQGSVERSEIEPGPK